MYQDILDIRKRMRVGSYSGRAAIYQGVVQRILNGLGWPMYNPDIVVPDPVTDSKIDLALCNHSRTPEILIKVSIENHNLFEEVEALNKAAYQHKIVLAVLTDGRFWRFYFINDFEESSIPFRILDIMSGEVEIFLSPLKRYLEKEKVDSGKFKNDIQDDIADNIINKDIETIINAAWLYLVETEDETIINRIHDHTRKISGIDCDHNQILDFLKSSLTKHLINRTENDVSAGTHNRQKVAGQDKNGSEKRLVIKSFTDKSSSANKVGNKLPYFGFELEGKSWHAKTGREILKKVLNLLEDREAGFLDRFASSPKSGSRNYVARTRRQLNTSRPDLTGPEYAHELREGWFVDVNLSYPQIESVIKKACTYSELEFGKDLVLNLKK